MIQKSIKMTSKGQLTLPVQMRNAMGISEDGDTLLLTFHEKSGELTLEKPVDINKLGEELTAHVRSSGIPPLSDADLRQAREAAWLQRAEQING